LSPPIATGGSIAVDLQAQGGVPPYSWQVSGGALPPGVALAPNGHLSGTATQAGTFDFEVTVTDSPGSTARRSYSLIVTTLAPTLRVDVTPNPDTFTIPVTITVTVGGAATTATGAVHLWVAGTGTRCPTPFAGGNPGDPLAIARNATLASGRAQFTVPNLPVDDYLVCVRYDGDSVYASADNGPQTLNVIKGVLLAPPTVTLAAPAQVPPRSIVVAQVSVAPVGTTQMPQGTVSLRGIPGSAAVATLTNGAAEVAFIAPATGSVALTVDYAGDGAFPAASSPAVSIAVAADTAIPALSPPALGMLALLLGGLAVHALRRRRR